MVSKGLEIVDEENENRVDLLKILDKIPEGQSLYWSILWLEFEGNLENISVSDLKMHIASLKTGLQLPWEDLNELVKKFNILHDLILIGNKIPINFGREMDDNLKYTSCEYYIQRFDTWSWILYSRNEHFINSLENCYKVHERFVLE